MRKWVVDASPVILLARIDHVALLTDLSDELMIPAYVADEIAVGPADDPARRWLQSAGRTFVEAGVALPRRLQVGIWVAESRTPIGSAGQIWASRQ